MSAKIAVQLLVHLATKRNAWSNNSRTYNHCHNHLSQMFRFMMIRVCICMYAFRSKLLFWKRKNSL